MEEEHPDYQKAFKKILRYCAYQERCKAEVKQKLKSLGLPLDSQESILQKLVKWEMEKYLSLV